MSTLGAAYTSAWHGYPTSLLARARAASADVAFPSCCPRALSPCAGGTPCWGRSAGAAWMHGPGIAARGHDAQSARVPAARRPCMRAVVAGGEEGQSWVTPGHHQSTRCSTSSPMKVTAAQSCLQLAHRCDPLLEHLGLVACGPARSTLSLAGGVREHGTRWFAAQNCSLGADGRLKAATAGRSCDRRAPARLQPWPTMPKGRPVSARHHRPASLQGAA